MQTDHSRNPHARRNDGNRGCSSNRGEEVSGGVGRARSVSSPKIGPLLVLSASEIELLEALSQRHPPISLIRQYAAYVGDNPTDRAGSFSTYVSNMGLAKDLDHGRSIANEIGTMAFEEAKTELERRMGTSSLS